ncbi:MAG: hypothetical protein HQL95_11085 [Magnetococcales bacterium]|nr:hypothetical protein [Magnetococcales bacterium]
MKGERSAGFSLISMALFLMLLGVALSTLMLLIPDMETLAKEKTVAHLRADRNALLGHAASRGRLPESEQFASVVPHHLDGYLNPIQYAYDSRLTGEHSICSVAEARLSVAEQSGVALVIWSHGHNGRVNQTNGTPDKRSGPAAQSTMMPHPAYSNRGTPDDITDDLDDLLVWVTLDELRQQAGCGERGESAGLPEIVVDGVPVGFEGQSYGPLTFAVQGGIPGGEWSWCVESDALVSKGALHGRLVLSQGNVTVPGGCGNSFASTLDATLTLTGKTPFAAGDGSFAGRSYDLRVFARDGSGLMLNRAFQLTVRSLQNGGDPAAGVKLSGSSRISPPTERKEE